MLCKIIVANNVGYASVTHILEEFTYLSVILRCSLQVKVQPNL